MTQTIVRVNNRTMLEEAFNVRRRVFVEEQKVPEDIELDEYDEDPRTIHMLARDLEGQAVGTGRLRPYKGGAVAKVERVAVLQSYRGTGLGQLLMASMEAQARRAGFHEVFLNAQLHARGFYERLGYKAEGNTFIEAGIEHIAMRKKL